MCADDSDIRVVDSADHRMERVSRRAAIEERTCRAKKSLETLESPVTNYFRNRL